METQQVKITSLSAATLLSKETPAVRNPGFLEGTLAYMSPEQTGRMNRSLDYRTDFYSLGVTFYEMLTGQLPFLTTNSMELVHDHIARVPTPPHLISRSSENREIEERDCPEAVSNIVMKLLAKNAEERYQSTYGLKVDLETCLTQLQENGHISCFSLGQHDVSSKLLIPQKLYGREQEVAVLLAAFARASGNEEQPSTAYDRKELILVTGYSGIGKSSLVNEVHKPIVQKHGYFIAGKFDQFKRNIPYSGWVQAFQDLIRQLLTESFEELQTWRAAILEAVGMNSQVIIDVIPELELIIGQQPTVAAPKTTEFQHQFNRVFKQLAGVFAQPEHPLVIFLDDLQWIDLASLKLFQLLMTDSDIQHLLLIGAYRDNEVSATHPLMTTLEEIERTKAVVNQINLRPLDLSHVTQLISDTLHCEVERCQPLVTIAFQKTAGNPFFLTQLLETMHQENLLFFDFSRGCWQWDLQQIRDRNILDDVVELMVYKIQQLGEAVPTVLALAACVGNQFDLNALSIVHQKPPLETANDLWRALQAGLILPSSDTYLVPQVVDRLDRDASFVLPTVNYKFLHDRVQQAAYALIPSDRKSEVHLEIGKLLLRNTSPEELEDNIFEIVNQLNIGLELITDQPEKNTLAKLNLLAGQKAKAATAYEAAVRYLTIGCELLADNSWQEDYELTLALYVEATEAEYLSTHFEQANQLAEVVLHQSKSVLDKVQIYERQIQFYISQNQLHQAVELGLKVLRMLGMVIPEHLIQQSIVMESLCTQMMMRGKQIEDLSSLPEMTNPEKLAVMRVSRSVIAAAYMAVPQLYPLLVLKALNFSLRHGNSSMSPLTYSQYGVYLCTNGDAEAGYRGGQLALRLLEQFDAYTLKCKVYFLFSAFIKHRKEPIRETVNVLLEAYQSGFAVGDIEFACYSVSFHYMHLFFVGESLGFVAQKQAQYLELMTKLKQEFQIIFIGIWRNFVLGLMGDLAESYRLEGEQFDEVGVIGYFTETNNYQSLFFVHHTKSVLSYFLQDYAQAAISAELAEKYVETVSGMVVLAEHRFYHALILLEMYSTASNSEQRHILRRVRSHQKVMKQWAVHAPANYQHQYDLVEAETARVAGRALEAMNLYDRAGQDAREHGYIQVEALANELAARFYLSLDKPKIANPYLEAAVTCYEQWGAMAKVASLKSSYPHLSTQLASRSPNTVEMTPIASITPDHPRVLDYETVIKASQALSKEMVLSNLLERFMQILVENAGARTGFFITKKDNQFVIEAQVEVNDSEAIMLHSMPMNTASQHLPMTLIHYVERTREDVVLNNASLEGRFTSDPYIVQHRSKSILCLPIIHQGKLTGILYLANDLVAGVFTPDRLEILKLLTAQVAISIENARLYTQLEQQVQERTAQLQRSLTFEATLKRITDKVRDSLDESQILQTTVEELAIVLGVDCCDAGIYDSEHQTSTIQYEYTTSMDSIQGQVIQLDTMPDLYAQLLQGQDFQFCMIIPETLRSKHQFAMLACPIVDNEGTLGDLWLFRPKEAAFSELEIRLVQQVANQCAIAIRQARLYQAAQTQVQTLEELNQLKDDFLSTVSHELRTPISNMKMAIYMLNQIPDPERQQRYLNILQYECAREAELINDLLDLQRLAVGTMSLNLETIQLQEWLPESLEPFYERTENRQQHLQVDIAPDLPPLTSDPASLSRIVAELLNNACKYTPPGEWIRIMIRIKAAMVGSQEPRYASLVISVSNSGVEIPVSELPHVFDRFYRVAGADRWKQGGTGLGLALVQKLVDHLGGTIRVESTTNLTCFTVELPL
ncbi:AAA family ATPase [Phormidium sp. FACHB-592]|nr:AAA family ATPase [Phormidium sp. FACHB-592]